jgi:type IV pilus assembly protein PilW
MNRRTNPLLRERGFTLIEVMIALLISMLLLVSFLQIYLSNSQTYRLIQNLARVQENGRFAIDFLAYNIRMAGFRSRQNADFPDKLNAVEGCERDTGPCSVGTTSDTLTVRYDATTDCTGSPVPPDPVPRFTQNTFYIDDAFNLTCVGNRNPGIPQPLVDNVESMQLLYGEDINEDRAADRYVSASALDVDRSRNIVSIQIILTVRTHEDNVALETGPAPKGGTDRRLRRVFTGTVALRNPE